jgi:hypothetical protein
MKAKIVVPLALVFVLLAAVPIYAAPPVVETGEVDDIRDFLDCGDFLVLDRVLYTYRSTSFYDEQGTLLKIITVANGTDNLYNPDNDTIVLTGHFTSVDTDNRVTGEYTSSGSFFSINIPGYGKPLRAAGRYRASTDRFVGVWTLDEKSAELVCATLAGP